jgi:hypothetical protein
MRRGDQRHPDRKTREDDAGDQDDVRENVEKRAVFNHQ